MTLTLQLDEEQSRRLIEIARDLDVDPAELVRAAINDLVSRPGEDFDQAAQRVLDKNRELYKRLS